MKNYLLILMVVFGMSSCSSYNDMDVAIETPEDSKSKSNVYNQTQVTQKFGRRSNLDQIQMKLQSQNEKQSFIIDTDRIYSVEEENYHSLTYLVAYPDQPERIVNLIFFSTDYKSYHPAIVEYNLSPAEVAQNKPIERDKINVIPIRPGEDYLKTLGNPTRIGLDGCVIVIVEAIGGKCESGLHGPGEPCDYAGGPGAAKVSYRIIYDFSNCDDDDTGGGSSGGTPPSSGYPGGVNPTNPGTPPAGYQPPYFGGGPGSWIPSQPVKTVPWWPLPGRMEVILFKSGLNADQKQWWADNVESPQRAGIFKYVSEGGDHAFAAWAMIILYKTLRPHGKLL